jgi:hypothetical protein
LAHFRIVEEHAVTKAIGRAFDVFERTDDAINVLFYVLEHDASVLGHKTVEDPEIYWYKVPGKPYIKYPTVTALYNINGDLVNILNIRIQHGSVIFHSAAFERK